MTNAMFYMLLCTQHFHYGYFLYAAGVIGKFRPDFVKTHKAAVMSIVRDIASPDQSE